MSSLYFYFFNSALNGLSLYFVFKFFVKNLKIKYTLKIAQIKYTGTNKGTLLALSVSKKGNKISEANIVINNVPKVQNN